MGDAESNGEDSQDSDFEEKPKKQKSLSWNEKLRRVNQAFQNCRDENIILTNADIERQEYFNAPYQKSRQTSKLPDFYKCPLCPKYFPHQRRHLGSHLRKSHPMEWEVDYSKRSEYNLTSTRYWIDEELETKYPTYLKKKFDLSISENKMVYECQECFKIFKKGHGLLHT